MWNCNDYKEWLKARLTEIKASLDFSGYQIEVMNEQDFAKDRSIKPKTITVVIKALESSLVFSAKTQPVQTLIFSEENGFGVANSIMMKFAETYNFVVTSSDATYVKHMYSTPVVLSNFNLIGIGLRTVLYMSTTLFVLENVMDISGVSVKISGVNNNNPISLEPMSATLGYTMSGDPQPFGSYHAVTEKNFSTLVMTLNVACVKNGFTQRCVEIMRGNSQGKGNESFLFSFSVGDMVFTDVSMKLIGSTVTTAVNSVPSIQLSFSV